MTGIQKKDEGDFIRIEISDNLRVLISNALTGDAISYSLIPSELILESQLEVESLQNRLEQAQDTLELQRKKIIAQRAELKRAAQIMIDYKKTVMILGKGIDHIAAANDIDFLGRWNETEIEASKFIQEKFIQEFEASDDQTHL